MDGISDPRVSVLPYTLMGRNPKWDVRRSPLPFAEFVEPRLTSATAILFSNFTGSTPKGSSKGYGYMHDFTSRYMGADF